MLVTSHPPCLSRMHLSSFDFFVCQNHLDPTIPPGFLNFVAAGFWFGLCCIWLGLTYSDRFFEVLEKTLLLTSPEGTGFLPVARLEDFQTGEEQPKQLSSLCIHGLQTTVHRCTERHPHKINQKDPKGLYTHVNVFAHVVTDIQ